MVNYLGVRNCKNLIKDLFFPDILIYSNSYKRYSGFESLSGYFGDFDYKFSFLQRKDNSVWIHIEVYDLDFQVVNSLVYDLDPTHTYFIYDSERPRKELQAL